MCECVFIQNLGPEQARKPFSHFFVIKRGKQLMSLVYTLALS